MKAVTSTHMGLRRENNEDSLLALDEKLGKLSNLFAVADGMGGHQAGEVASSMALKMVVKALSVQKEDAIEDLLKHAILAANDEIFKAANQDSEKEGMGTTVLLTTIYESILYFAYVGDSRLYHFLDNELIPLTKDHSLVRQLYEKGEIEASELRTHPNRSTLTRAVGTSEDLQVDTGNTPFILNKSTILLCTDGLTDMISEDLIKDILQSEKTLKKKIEKLIEAALHAGGRDNVSVVLVG